MATLKVNVSLTAYMLDTIGLVMLGRFSGEYLYFCLCWSIVAENLLFLVLWTWWNTWIQIQRGKLGLITWVCKLLSCIFPELILFALVLKCRGLHNTRSEC